MSPAHYTALSYQGVGVSAATTFSLYVATAAYMTLGLSRPYTGKQTPRPESQRIAISILSLLRLGLLTTIILTIGIIGICGLVSEICKRARSSYAFV